MNLGYVGLGNMGGPMVANFLKAGYTVYVYDLSPVAVERAVQAGAVALESARAVAEAGEMIFTSLPTPAAVKAVFLGDRGLLEGAKAGQIFFDLSSITPSLAREISERFQEKGAVMLDSPVSGGVTGAAAGTLAIMVGGDQEAFRKGEPVLKAIGGNVYHVGPVGASSTVKMFNQLLVGIANAGVVEMVALARKTGIDLALVKEIISTSSGDSRIFRNAFPKAVDRDFAPGFAVDLMAKDLRIVRDMASEFDLQLPLAASALSIFEKASQMGAGSQDVMAALQIYEPGQ